MSSLYGECFVIMPAYNAGATIEQVFSRIPGQVRQNISKYVVVDDGSTDDTLKALERLREEFSNLIILRHERNSGYGAAEKTLLDYARDNGAEIAILLHADGQYAPEKIPELLEPLRNDSADIVQGSRILGGSALAGGMPVYKYLANRILTWFENLAFGLSLAEYHSGYMVYSRRAFDIIDYNRLSGSFDFDLEMIVAARVFNLRVKEIPIPTRYEDEISHLNPIRYGLDVLKVIYRYRCGYYHRLMGVEKSDLYKQTNELK